MRNGTITMILVAASALLILADTASAYYSPQHGRFLNRDPIDEPGAVLLRKSAAQENTFIPRNSARRVAVSQPPVARKFIARDSKPGEGELNCYLSMRNNAVGLVDPHGLEVSEAVHEACPGVDNPPQADECLKCEGRAAGSICDSYDATDLYQGFSASCVCKCMSSTPQNDQVRSCLACMKEAGVDPDTAHKSCYAAAGAAKYGLGMQVCTQCGHCAVTAWGRFLRGCCQPKVDPWPWGP